MFAGAGLTRQNLCSGWNVLGVGDYTKDGRADILCHNTNGSASIWLKSGTAVLSGSGLAGENQGTSWNIMTSTGR